MEYYLAFKKKKIMLFAISLIFWEGIILKVGLRKQMLHDLTYIQYLK